MINVYGALVMASIRSHMAYRAAFWLKVLTLVLSYGATLTTTWAAVSAFGSLGGWGFTEIVLLYGLGVLCYGVVSLLLWEMRNVTTYVRLGLLDSVLIKPVVALLFIAARRIELTSIGHLTVGIALVTWSWRALALPIGGAAIAKALLFISCGILIMASFQIASGALAFWIVSSRAVWNMQADLREMSWYPLSIFPGTVQVLLATVYPLAFVSFLPAIGIAGITARGVYPRGIEWLAPLVAGAMLIGALALWRLGLRHYEGTGS